MITVETQTKAERPQGAPFVVDRTEFRYGEKINIALLDLAEDKILNWPMVYILANDDFAYVGQTTSVATRMTQHGANEEKRDFTTVNIIFNEEFNTSVITDYEHRLIGYMQADGKYKLTNKNAGMTDTNYFSKAQYSEMFEDLWETLRNYELVDHTVSEIEESEVFKYSPFKGLTVDQQVALEEILETIKNGLNNANPIVVQGMPGTGKTVLAVFLLKMLKDDPKYSHLNIKLLEPITSLRKSLKESLKGISGLSENDVIGPFDLAKEASGFVSADTPSFDIVLVDESHKLKRRVNLGPGVGSYDKINRKLGLPKEATQMDWISSQVRLPIFFYDPLQAIGPSCLSPENITQTIGEAIKHPISLDSQMRVKGGKGYLEYISDILSGNNPSFSTFDEYELVLHEDFTEFVDSFESHYTEHSLSRMVAGYAWKWVTQKDSNPEAFDIEFDGIRLRWNSDNIDWVGKGFSDEAIAHEVGCIHTIQGYDLSYTYVIIGEDLRFDEETGELRADRTNYFDVNGKNTATEAELTQYIKNIYYVLLTRGIYGTHIYIANPKLREYFAKYIPVFAIEK